MPKACPKDIFKWKNLILECQDSGLSIPEWCRQNQIPVHNFRYWHKKLFSKDLERSAFLEIAPQQVTPGIHLECQGVKIHLEQQFDLLVLEKCIRAIKRC